MELFVTVFKSMVSLALCMAAGYACRKTGVINDERGAGLSGLMINVVLPSMIISSMQKPFTGDLIVETAMVLGLALMSYLLGTLAGFVLCRVLKLSLKDTGVIVFVLTFPNIVYMGLPVIRTIFGLDSVLYISIASIVFNGLSFTLGIRLITLGSESNGKSHEKRPVKAVIKGLLFNIPLISVAVGMALFVLSIELPEPIFNALSMMGDMTVPLSMIVTGSILAKADWRTLFSDVKLYVVSFLRLVAIPAVMFFLCRGYIANDILLGSVVLMAGMPAAALTAILADAYGGNTLEATKYVCVTTLLSLFTIPAVSLLFSI